MRTQLLVHNYVRYFNISNDIRKKLKQMQRKKVKVLHRYSTYLYIYISNDILKLKFRISIVLYLYIYTILPMECLLFRVKQYSVIT